MTAQETWSEKDEMLQTEEENRNIVNFERYCEASIRFQKTNLPEFGYLSKLKPKDFYLLSEVCLSFNGRGRAPLRA